MKIKNKRLITSEIILILASVFIFRGLWTLLDKIPVMNEEKTLLLSLFLAIIISAITLHYMATHRVKIE